MGGGGRLFGGRGKFDTFCAPVFVGLLFEIVGGGGKLGKVSGGGRLLMFGKVGGCGRLGNVGGGGKLPILGGGGKFGRLGGGGKLAIFGSVGGGGKKPIFGKVGGGGNPPTGMFRVGGGGKFPPVLTIVGEFPKLSCASSKALAFLIASGLPLIYSLGLEGAYLGRFCLNKLASRCFFAYENAPFDDFYVLVYTLGCGFWGYYSYRPIYLRLFFIRA